MVVKAQVMVEDGVVDMVGTEEVSEGAPPPINVSFGNAVHFDGRDIDCAGLLTRSQQPANQRDVGKDGRHFAAGCI